MDIPKLDPQDFSAWGVPEDYKGENTSATDAQPKPNTSGFNHTWTPPWDTNQREWEWFNKQEDWKREDYIMMMQQAAENSAMQRRFKDLKEAGISPYAAIALNALGGGAGVASQGTSSTSAKGNNSMGALIGGMIAAIALLAGKGIGAASAAKNANKVKKTLNISRVYRK